MTDLEERLRKAPSRSSTARPSSGARPRAGKASLLDVAYAELDSPIGQLVVFVTPRGLLRVKYADEPIDERPGRGRGPRVATDPACATRTDPVRRELEGYFALRRRSFDLPIDWSLVHGFAGSVLRETARIPFGDVRRYGQVARQAGSPEPPARPATRSARTRSRSWCRATGSSTPMVDSVATPAASTGSGTCSPWRGAFRLSPWLLRGRRQEPVPRRGRSR